MDSACVAFNSAMPNPSGISHPNSEFSFVEKIMLTKSIGRAAALANSKTLALFFLSICDSIFYYYYSKMT